MASHGIQTAWLALVDENQKLITGANGLTTSGIYQSTDNDLGIQQANITNMEGSASKVYANNTVVQTNYSKGMAEVALTFTQLPIDVKYKAAGFVQDEAGGWYYGGSKPNVALLLQTSTLDSKGQLYIAFPCGTLSFASMDIQTDNDSVQNAYDAGTFTAKSANVYNGNMFGVYSSQDTKFNLDNLKKIALGGYTATAG